MYGVKTLNAIKATITCWLSHDPACKRIQKRHLIIIIIKSLDGIIRKDPKAELIGLCNQILNSQTLLQICFLEDVLSITIILSLVLQSANKDFAAVHKTMQVTCLKLKQIRDTSQSSLLKSFLQYNKSFN